MTGAYDAWVGRVETAEDAVSARDCQRMAALLDADRAPGPIDDGAALPPLWHWLAFAPAAGMADLGRDGHPALGGFLPPVGERRRMWAGGRLTFGPALKVGEGLRRRSGIVNIADKTGASGPMVFVTVAHRTEGAGGGWVEEVQDIVYVAMPERFSPPPPQPVAEGAAWVQPFEAGPTRLFRYSALTFNGHRIHYDLPYAQGVEKYPGLVVHGPLQATLMVEAARARQPGRAPEAFRYRGTRPLFPQDAPCVAGWDAAEGKQALVVATAGGLVTMQGEIDWGTTA